MYKGTLIDDLMATVDRAESSLRLDPEQDLQLTYWYAQQNAAHASYELAGVA